MGHIQYVRGDLLKTDCKVIAHGVNCQGVFGAGVAYQVARVYPEVKKAYLDNYNNHRWIPGDIQVVKTASGISVVNMAIQDTYGSRGIHVDYAAVEECFYRLFTAELGDRIAIPKIGSGLAGGDWDQIEEIIRINMGNREVTVEVYSL